MNMPVAKIDEILKTSRDPVSLDTPIGEEEDSQLGDFIEDESLPVSYTHLMICSVLTKKLYYCFLYCFVRLFSGSMAVGTNSVVRVKQQSGIKRQ